MSFGKDAMAITNKVILNTSSDWESWNEYFKSQAVSFNVWNHIQGTARTLPEPERPTMEGYRYPQRRTITTHSTVETRSRPQQSEFVAPEDPGQSLDPEPSQGTVGRSVAFSDLTTDDQKAFGMAWSFYLDDMKLYDKQQESFRKLRSWVNENISDHFRLTCCKSTESISIWYQNLKKAPGATSFFRERTSPTSTSRSTEAGKDFERLREMG
jgi:hypothetical protein